MYCLAAQKTGNTHTRQNITRYNMLHNTALRKALDLTVSKTQTNLFCKVELLPTTKPSNETKTEAMLNANINFSGSVCTFTKCSARFGATKEIQ